jgi:hypothetical protein
MIVHDLNLEGVSRVPDKTNSPLVVNPDRVLPGPFTLQLLQSVAGDMPEFIKSTSSMNRDQLLQSAALHVTWNPPTGSAGEKLRRFP